MCVKPHEGSLTTESQRAQRDFYKETRKGLSSAGVSPVNPGIVPGDESHG